MNRPKTNRESGFALLLVFAMAGAVAIMLYTELPRAVFESQRAKEALLIERGEQYQRAIQVYFRKFRKYPARMEELENTNNVRFLRRRYIDPMTGTDEWRLIHIGPAGEFVDSAVHKPKTPATEERAENRAPAALDPVAATFQGPVAVAFRQRPSDKLQPGSGPEIDPAQAPGPYDPNAPPPPVLREPPGQQGAAYPGQQFPGQQTTVLTSQTPYGQQFPNTGQQPNTQTSQLPYPGQAQPYPGQAQPYPGQAQPYPGQAQPYPGQAQPYPGQTQPYPGQVPPQAGQAGQPFPFPVPGIVPGMPRPPSQSIGQSNPAAYGGVAAIPGYPTAPANSQTGGTAPLPGQQPGANPNVNPALDLIRNLLTTPRPGGLAGSQPSAPGFTGGIAGVASKYEAQGIKLINERSKIHEWEFLYDFRRDRTVAGGLGAAGGAGSIVGIPGAPPGLQGAPGQGLAPGAIPPGSIPQGGMPPGMIPQPGSGDSRGVRGRGRQ